MRKMNFLTLMLSFVTISAFGAAGSALNASFSPNARIVGGAVAPEGAFPYQVSIRYSNANHTCGGSIINQWFILTSADCVTGKSPSGITVVAGTNRLNQGGIRYGVSNIRAHPRYSSLTLKNDIALLKLALPISFSSTVMSMEPATSNVGANVDAVLSGWGLTSYPGSTPNSLQYLFLKTISVSDCKKSFYFPNVDDTQICTLTRRGEGACHGDRGSPLVAGGYLIGIVSWGQPCAVGLPDVYTRVSYFNDWIIKNSY